jgi:predicted CoA-binding protein
MTSLKQAAATFLSNRRIAVTGVSSMSRGHGANPVYRRLRERGYEALAVNPRERQIGDLPCYPSLSQIPGGVDAVVIADAPELTEATMQECVQLGIRHVWVHRALGTDSVCTEATVQGRDHGIMVIDGGCPLMFPPAADLQHRIIRRVLARSGKIPASV